MKQTFLALLAIAFLVSSCDNAATTKNEGIDTFASPDAYGVAWAQNAFPRLYAKLKAQDASFNPALFEETEGGAITLPPPQLFPPEELAPFRPYLIYDADSSRAIDLVSYNYLITKKDGQPLLEPTGPDTEVAVIDLKTGMRTRIFFSGPGTVIQEGKWLDKNTVLLGGAETRSNSAIAPFLLRIDLKNASLQRFTYTESLQAQLR